MQPRAWGSRFLCKTLTPAMTCQLSSFWRRKPIIWIWRRMLSCPPSTMSCCYMTRLLKFRAGLCRLSHGGDNQIMAPRYPCDHFGPMFQAGWYTRWIIVNDEPVIWAQSILDETLLAIGLCLSNDLAEHDTLSKFRYMWDIASDNFMVAFSIPNWNTESNDIWKPPKRLRWEFHEPLHVYLSVFLIIDNFKPANLRQPSQKVTKLLHLLSEFHV